MTHPTEDFNAPAAGSCEAFQWEISLALDERRPLDAPVLAHLQTCPHCAAFAEGWDKEGPHVRSLHLTPPSNPALADRIIQAALTTDELAKPERPRRSSEAPWLRWAAALALGALGWWLLDPKTVPSAAPVASHSTSPALAMNRQVARLEQPMVREQAALHGAATEGLTRLREVFDWSAGVLQ